LKIRPQNLGWLKNYFSVLDSNNSVVMCLKDKTTFFMDEENHHLKVVEYFPQDKDGIYYASENKEEEPSGTNYFSPYNLSITSF